LLSVFSLRFKGTSGSAGASSRLGKGKRLMIARDGWLLAEGRLRRRPLEPGACFCSPDQPTWRSSREREEAGCGRELGTEGTDEGCKLTGSSWFFGEHLLGRHADAVLHSSPQKVKLARYPAKAKSARRWEYDQTLYELWIKMFYYYLYVRKFIFSLLPGDQTEAGPPP